MLNLSTQNILLLTVIVIAVELGIFAILLRRQDLFHWTSAGFWAWASFALYFVVNPLTVVVTGNNLVVYQIRLSLSGGTFRGLWILVVIVAGIIVFFVAYLRPPSKKISNSKILTDKVNLPLLLFFSFWFIFGLYSLVAYRTFRPEGVLIVQGRFVGNTTGYQDSGYMFLFLPLALLLLSKKYLLRFTGYLLTFIVIFLALPLGWNRSALVSLLLLLTLTIAVQSKRKWPPVWWIIIIIIFAAGLQIRGHSNVSLDKVKEVLFETTSRSVTSYGDVLSSGDSAMLATFYLESYLRDSIIGYQYGIPLLNYAITGWIPYRFFPQKYFLVDWLLLHQGTYPVIIQRLLYGAKSAMFGNLYTNGGIFGVVIGAYLFGRLSRQAEVYLKYGNILMRASILALMAQLWMIWGSGLSWGLVNVGFIAMPAMTFWIAWPRKEQTRTNLWCAIDSKPFVEN